MRYVQRFGSESTSATASMPEPNTRTSNASPSPMLITATCPVDVASIPRSERCRASSTRIARARSSQRIVKVTVADTRAADGTTSMTRTQSIPGTVVRESARSVSTTREKPSCISRQWKALTA